MKLSRPGLALRWVTIPLYTVLVFNQQLSGISSVYVHGDGRTGVRCYANSVLLTKLYELEMWANAERDGRPVEHRWRPLFNAAKFG